MNCSDIEIPTATRPTLTSYLIEMAKFSRIVRKVLKVVDILLRPFAINEQSYSAESTKLSFPVWTEELHNLTQELAVPFMLLLLF